jgi:non-lysosomal glucosylceramidase
MSKPDILKFAWKRRLDQIPVEPGVPKKTPLGETVALLPTMMRMRGYINRERKAGHDLVIDPFHPLDPGVTGGVPLGGIGGGSIMRGWRGGFSRWQLRPGTVEYRDVPADQFSVYIRRGSGKPRMQVLNADQPASGGLHGWAWGMSGRSATYYALFPRAWTTYDDIDPKVRLTCRQISPVIPHNYKESSTPAGVFVWTIENNSKETATVGLLFTFQNGTGAESDREAGHWNRLFRSQSKSGEVTGIEMHHILPQQGEATKDDPLTFAIAAQASDDVRVTYRTRFVTSSSGMDVWGDFANDGSLENIEDDKKSSSGLPIGAALCATVEVPPGKSREIVFALAWDMPLARFGEGRAHYHRYTRFYGREGNAVQSIASDALANYPAWEKQIDEWQAPILADSELPDWYKAALFNELYFITDGGTIWTDGEEGEPPLNKNDIGHFAYLEGHEYRMYNTYDVHFYASFALAILWPDLELSLQRDIANAMRIEHPESVRWISSGQKTPRKVIGSIPHDLGAPAEDPWHKVNVYNFQDTNHWKDLNSKFVLQIYRDIVATGDKKFAAEMWEPVCEAIEYLRQFDLDDDEMIENEGFPDQTYDTWVADDVSAYSGGLWAISSRKKRQRGIGSG